MKDLSRFEPVKKALEQVVAESDVNNGTQGVYFAYSYDTEYVFDKDRNEIQEQMGRMLLGGHMNPVEYQKLQQKLDATPKPPVVMVWKLVEPIKILRGTKIAVVGNKSYKLEMTNVDTIYIPENAIKLGLLEYEETKETRLDAQGRESMVLKLKLKRGIIDVAAPQTRGGKETRPKRAYVTPISYKALQTVGSMLFRERMQQDRLYGFDEIA